MRFKAGEENSGEVTPTSKHGYKEGEYVFVKAQVMANFAYHTEYIPIKLGSGHKAAYVSVHKCNIRKHRKEGNEI